MTDPNEVLAALKRTLRFLVGATVVLYIALGAVVLWTFSTASTNSDALCALRGDLEKRVETSREFLAENPNGIPGIPDETIQTGIENQLRTIGALGNLSCPE